MSRHDKKLLDSLFIFKELGMNLINSVSDLLEFSSSRNKGSLGFPFNFREPKKKRRFQGGFFFINLVF